MTRAVPVGHDSSESPGVPLGELVDRARPVDSWYWIAGRWVVTWLFPGLWQTVAAAVREYVDDAA